MSKSALYATNTIAQDVAVTTDTTINFGQPVRRFGCDTYLSGGNAIIRGCGYYAIDTVVNFTALTAGTVVVQLFKDGVAIPGAASTISMVADDVNSFEISSLVRNTCECESTITAVISGATGTINTASIRVIKL